MRALESENMTRGQFRIRVARILEYLAQPYNYWCICVMGLYIWWSSKCTAENWV